MQVSSQPIFAIKQIKHILPISSYKLCLACFRTVLSYFSININIILLLQVPGTRVMNLYPGARGTTASPWSCRRVAGTASSCAA